MKLKVNICPSCLAKLGNIMEYCEYTIYIKERIRIHRFLKECRYCNDPSPYYLSIDKIALDYIDSLLNKLIILY